MTMTSAVPPSEDGRPSSDTSNHATNTYSQGKYEGEINHLVPVTAATAQRVNSKNTRGESKMLFGTYSWHWYLFASFVPVVLISLWLYTFHLVKTSMATIHDRHIALLIAHPDDEVMFFSPTIMALTKPELGNTLQVICFSSGDADGLGETRKKELKKSCNMLGIPSSPHAVTCVENIDLPDSMSKVWPAPVISSVMIKTLSSTPEINTLITFDESGVSYHPNHISLLEGAREYIRSVPHPHPLLLYTLSSVSLPRKYASIFDGITTLLQRWRVRGEGWGGEGAPNNVLFVNGWEEYRRAQNAMVHGHESQMRWFRWGWIVLSRYLVINDLKLEDVVATK